MKTSPRLALLLFVTLGSLFGQAKEDPVDFNRARQLMERQRSGATLSADERAYVARAVAQRNASGGGGRPGNQRTAPERITPLTDLGATERYEGEGGGLYGGGKNTPPETQRRAAREQLANIRPLNTAGDAADDGLIGFVAISMSNATQEFSRFKQIADGSPLKSARVAIVDCAQGGQAMAQWVRADAGPWEEAQRRLAAAKVAPLQVQVAWIKLANVGPTGSLQEHGRKLESDTLAVLQHARACFPNLRIAYLGSRTYGGYAKSGLNPEPYAFEGAFAARWLIERQVKGDAELALAKAPLLLWGPYLWADGTRGRKIDTLVWERGDFGDDGVHPSTAGRQKVAKLLLDFYTTDDLAKSWFTGK